MPLLCTMKFAGGIATFAMSERKFNQERGA